MHLSHGEIVIKSSRAPESKTYGRQGGSVQMGGASVRIGTWNMQGRWSPDHLSLLVAHDCDVWLLTEVNDRLSLPDYHYHVYPSAALMAAHRHWVTILSRDVATQLVDPHPANAAVTIGATT